MSVVTDLLDRLSGVAVVRERLGDTAKRVDALAERFVDHERRITRLETIAQPEPARGGKVPHRK
jgi:hypothetical protein